MLNKGFTLLLERWIVIPLIGALIAHGFITQGDSEFWIVLLDNVLGGLFIIGAWILTHKSIPGENVNTKIEQKTIWQKIYGFIWDSSSEATAQVESTIQSNTPTA